MSSHTIKAAVSSFFPRTFEFIVDLIQMRAMSSSTDVIIIGGSIAGLMHALVLQSLGRNVRVFEARSHAQMGARAAGLSLWSHAQELVTKYIPHADLDAFAFRNREVHVLDGEGKLLSQRPVVDDVRTSSWAIVHDMLLKACIGCHEEDGSISLEMGTRLCDIKEEGDMMVVTIKDVEEKELRVKAGLVIAADGARSFIRSRVLPAVEPKYSGYLAWRGAFPERDAPPELECVLKGTLANFPLGGSYILV
jgi:2-polyprenyl-6-methoxyphenol hydroxylase-like FAD-dependent oxidoreductase